MVEMDHLAGSITFDYKGSRDIQIYHQRAALLKIKNLQLK